MIDDPEYLMELVLEELKCARAKHPAQCSCHEAYAVLLEEVDEFWEEVKKRSSVRSTDRMREELIQIAAMACRSILDLGL